MPSRSTDGSPRQMAGPGHIVPNPADREVPPSSESLPELPPPTPGIGALLCDYMQSFIENAPHLDFAALETAIDVLMRLIFLAQESAPPPGETKSKTEAVPVSKLSLIKQYIDDHLERGDLSPESTARAFHISVRQLHRLFRPTGTTFARYLLRRRVERVASLLAAASTTSIIDAAFACGFSGSSVFYRAFKTHFGLSPKNYLKSLAGAPQPA